MHNTVCKLFNNIQSFYLSKKGFYYIQCFVPIKHYKKRILGIKVCTSIVVLYILYTVHFIVVGTVHCKALYSGTLHCEALYNGTGHC